MNNSPAVILFDINGKQLAVQNGVAIPASTPSLLAAGSDGTNSRYITVDGTGKLIVVGSGNFAITAAALPLPTGASTEATLALIKAKTDNLDVALSTRAVTGLTDAQLRAVAVPVSGTFWQATQPVSGTFWQATQPISGSVTANIGTSGSLALETTQVKLTIAQSAALGANTQVMMGGSVTTAAPSYTNGNINPLCLTPAGLLRVDGSGATQPVSGTVTANAGTGTFGVSGTVTANIGTSGSLALDATLTGGTQQARITDGTNVATVKAASTAAVAADKALVVAISPNNALTTTTAKATTPAQSTVAASASNVALLALNANRLGATIFNDSASATLYVKLGTAASTSSYTAQLFPSGYYEIPYNYTGAIEGIWSAAVGNARITELT